VRRGLAAGVALAAACLSKPALVPQTFTIDGPAATRSVAPSGSGPVLQLRRVEMAAELEQPQLLYRLKGHRLERDPYAQLPAPPADVLTQAIAAYLRAGVAREVVEPGRSIPADWAVDVYASDLSGDFTDDAAAGSLVLQFRVLPVPGGAPVLDRTYASRRRLERRTAGEVVAAWNEGLAEIMKAFGEDVATTLAQARAASGGR
jgi:uncharacterized lipoprotein YmbA